MKQRRLPARRSPGTFGARLGLGEGLLQLLSWQHAVIQQTAPAASRGDAEALHDLRAAFRRVRCLLRVAGGLLPGAPKLSQALGSLNQDLGRQRDLDVWIAFLRRLEHKGKFATMAGWETLVQSQVRERQRQLPSVRRTLRSRRFAALSLGLHSLATRISLAATFQAGLRLDRFAARQLRDLLRRLRANVDWRRDRSPGVVHAVRKRFRRVRYLAEFFAPILGSEIHALSGELHEVEQRLGRAHDMDRATTFLVQCPTPIKPLAREIRRRRKKSLMRARAALKRVHWSKAEKALKRCLAG